MERHAGATGNDYCREEANSGGPATHGIAQVKTDSPLGMPAGISSGTTIDL